jgi:hypothetical protein
VSEYIVDFGTDDELFVRIAMVKQHGAELRDGIVRCRDCKWFTPEYWYEEERDFATREILCEPPDCGNPERCSVTYDSITKQMVPVHIVTEPDGYCAWGERIEP